jgi:hypothetical protein
MRKLLILFVLGILSCAGPQKEDSIMSENPVTEKIISKTIDGLKDKKGQEYSERIERGVKHAASLWRKEDGNSDIFYNFCMDNFIADEEEREIVFEKISKNFESLIGHFTKVELDLQENVHLDKGPLHSIDKMFAAYSVSANLKTDLYGNKIAFVVALNFPYYSLDDKESLGKKWSRKEWAYARLGDVFIARVPAELEKAFVETNTKSEIYISEYNIHMGKLRSDDGRQIFPEGMVLLSHWNLRDEIKANYADNAEAKEKQEMIYKVMTRIIGQDIPEKVINNPDLEWQPYANKVSENGKQVSLTNEPDVRYQQILNNFHALREIDAYHPEMDTYIKRKFSGEMEISQPQVEALFDEYLRSPQLKQIGEVIEKRLGRKLRPYDIWYDGFKARNTIPQETLTAKTSKKYRDCDAFNEDMPNLLQGLGWTPQRAEYIASKIVVDPARGSGHAAGAAMKGEKAHLRTRVPKDGMDYKGYNIAIHELGHNVEQTISLYDVDYYAMNGVPSTGFTEALAFIFQSRDLTMLGMEGLGAGNEHLKSVDAAWSLMEIMGVGMVDMKVWKWLYDNPDATASELKATVISIAKEVWNSYFAPVFGIDDSPVLAIYSHMISYPLYLVAYSYGQVIEFQIEEHLRGKDFSDEIDRIYQQGRLIPQLWMEEAVGNRLSTKPIINAVDEALEKI